MGNLERRCFSAGKWAGWLFAASSCLGCGTVLGIDPAAARNEGGEGGMDVGNAGEGGSGAAALPVGGSGAGGEGGERAPSCNAGDLRCGGDAALAPEVCAGNGWMANAAENLGLPCPELCAAGKCVECEEGAARCSPCAADDDEATCSARQRQVCSEGEWVTDENACPAFCQLGECRTPPSCDPVASTVVDCGPLQASCCRSELVPGGTFQRDFDGGFYADGQFEAQVGDFLLDKFEVTVGRMRAFANAFEAFKPELLDGSGKAARIPDDTGWSVDHILPDNAAKLEELLSCAGATWTPEVAENERLPINCVNFYVAYAFCIWDGGRLPSELEWNFAAAGGDKQREYPWEPPLEGEPITPEHANYGGIPGAPSAVGSFPLGDGRWRHADLAGNLLEWTLDYYGSYPMTLCVDCLNLDPTSGARSQRGGFFQQVGEFVRVSARLQAAPNEIDLTQGFRCARDVIKE